MRKIRLCNLVYKPLLKIMKIPYGKNLYLYGLPIIVKTPKTSITIGENCHIRSSFLSNLVGLYQRSIICVKGTGKIAVGNGVGSSGVTIYARESISIGDNCIIGGNVKKFDNDFHPSDPIQHENTPCEHFGVASVKIGRNVFIGCNSIILKGTAIGDNAVIGAGSVVSGDVPCNCVDAGNPARVVKTLM